MHGGPVEWHYLHTKFHENLPSGLKVISGGTDRHRHTNRQTGDLISLLSFLESRLKGQKNFSQVLKAVLVHGFPKITVMSAFVRFQVLTAAS
jgi:hypothetical protein